MATLINKDKQISKQRQEFVEHNFEAMVGARKRRYNDTQAQKQRTEFFEDYYLLYTRNKQQLDQQKARIEELEGQFAYECECNKQFVQLQKMWNELKEWLKEQINFDKEEIEENKEIPNLPNRHYLTIENIIIDKMQELEQGEKDVKD